MKKKIYLAILTVALSMLAAPGYAQMKQPCAPSTSLTLVVSKYHLNLLDKAPVCVKKGSAFFVIRVVGVFPDEMGEVTVSQKGANSPVQISGSYDNADRRITVGVFGTFAIDDEFEYLIKVEGVGELDPKIRIIPD